MMNSHVQGKWLMKSNPYITKINTYLHTHQELKYLYDRIKTLALFTQKIIAYIDPSIRKYCQITTDGNKLIILVENAAIATQLRFQTDDLLSKFKRDSSLKHIQHIHYKIRPPYSYVSARYTENKQQPLLLSQETATLMNNIAHTIKDPNLRRVMEKIASHIGDDKARHAF